MTLESCTEAYARKVLELSGKMNPLRNTAIVNLGAEAAVQHAVLRLNAENAFCEEDGLTGKIRLLDFNKMAKLVSEEI